MDAIQISETEKYHPGISPAIQDLSRDSGMPESEIAAIHAQEERDAETEIAKDPSKMTMDIFGNCRLGDQVWDATRAKVLTPEETDETEEELTDILGGMEDMFSPSTQTPNDTAEPASGFGGIGGFGGIDNNALGFSDDDMALTQSVADYAAQDYGLDDDSMEYGTDSFSDMSEVTPDEVNATPGTPSGGTQETDQPPEQPTDDE